VKKSAHQNLKIDIIKNIWPLQFCEKRDSGAKKREGVPDLHFGGVATSINMYKEISDGSIAAHSHCVIDFTIAHLLS
jgi:hypothetical protein